MQSRPNDPGLELSALVTLARVSHAPFADAPDGLRDELLEIVGGLESDWAQDLGRAIVSPENEAKLSPKLKQDLFVVRKLAGIEFDESDRVA